ncbi:MAG: type I DNA topoisomerase [Halarsenatibacteraceae bacterium]
MATKKKKTLVIVESPAKAKTIGKFLGSKYRVEASMGHVIDLPKSKLGVDIDNDFAPHYITIRGKGKVLKKLKKEAKKSKDVLLATDPDREGEAISWHLARALKLDDHENNRVVFNEITKNAISNALKSPREIDDNLVDAQQARRVLDRLVGYKLSPLLWKKVRKGLSAGRVQTVAVRIICEREREIEAFEPDEYWSITADLKKDKEKFSADLYRINNKKFNIDNEDDAKAAVAEIEKEDFVVSKVKKRNRKRNPYPPFTTSTLQQRASTLLNFSAKKTMFIAQQLYEGIEVGGEGTVGLISYIRSDSTRISQEAAKDAKSYIMDEFGDKYYQNKKRKTKNSDSAQDAHEAIRPTGVQRTPDKIKKYLSKDQEKLYRLIWERFVASQMAPAVYEIYTVNLKAGKKYLFRASGSKVKFPGFMKVLSYNGNNREELPVLEEGEKLPVEKIIPEQHFTQPPPRYTEASIVKTLEEEGIGRPSTYAPTISTIISREYVEKEGKSLKPTKLGFIVTDLLVEYFPDVTNVEFTATIENKLDQIEEGEVEWNKLLAEFYNPFSDRLETAREEMESVNIVEETDEVCEKCGSPMVVKYGRYGKFLACSAYPECKNTKAYVEKTGVDCPSCEDGEIIKRKSRKGRTFYGCSNYPDCEFVLWNKPSQKKCPECGGIMVEKRTKKDGDHLKCVNKSCGYKESR